MYSERLQSGEFMDMFIERNILHTFDQILQMNNRNVNMQLIQTTSIFVVNVKATERRCK